MVFSNVFTLETPMVFHGMHFENWSSLSSCVVGSVAGSLMWLIYIHLSYGLP